MTPRNFVRGSVRLLAYAAAITAALGFAQELGLDHVISLIHPDNAGSIGVARKLGLRWHDDIAHPGLDVPLIHRYRRDFPSN